MLNKLKSATILLVIPLLISSSLGLLNPVVFIPGDGGSQIDAKLNKTTQVHYLCQKTTTDYFNIWLNMELLVPVVIDCWIDNIKLVYDNATRKTANMDGVQTRVPGWGNSETVEWLDPSHASSGAYFKDIANTLVSIGHERNKSIKGAPFDFRKAPNENQDYFVRLKTLIEDTYKDNNNSPIVLIAHSMGGPMSLYFLNLQTQKWKDQYIKCLITLSGAWGGSIKAIKVFAIGDDLGSYALRESVMKQEQITNPSLAWLMPSPLFWRADEVLVQTDKKNYTLNNIKDYFYDLQYPTGWEMYKDVLPHTQNFSAPGVEVHCLYGSGVDTVEQLYYKPGTWLDGYPKLLNGDGDGTVNLRSLLGCSYWKQSQSIATQALPGVDHMTILKHPTVLSYIVNLFNRVS